jgi:hypothetical protein
MQISGRHLAGSRSTAALRNPTLRATALALVSRTSALDLSRGQSAASSREGQSEPIACLLDFG